MTNVVEEAAVATVEATEPVVKEATKTLSKRGKTALIVGGTAVGVTVLYFGLKKLVIPRINKRHHEEEVEEAPAAEEPVVEVEAEPVAEKKATTSKKQK